MNHLWSLDDDSGRLNGSYVEPWVSYVLPTDTTVSLSVESTYDWESSELGLPINFIVDQLIMIGDQPISVGATAKYWADSPRGGPQGWGFRLQFTLLFPK